MGSWPQGWKPLPYSMNCISVALGLTFGSDRSTSVMDRVTVQVWWTWSRWPGVDVLKSWEYRWYSVSGLRQVCCTVPQEGLPSPRLLQRWWYVWVGVAPPGKWTESTLRLEAVCSCVGRVENLTSDLWGTSRKLGSRDGLRGGHGEFTETEKKKIVGQG